jgi:hypothetical protein
MNSSRISQHGARPSVLSRYRQAGILRFLSCCWLTTMVVVMLAGCDRFLDVNKNPNFPETTAPSSYLPSIIANGSQQMQFSQLFGGSYITQYIAARNPGTTQGDRDRFIWAFLPSPFNDTYFRACSNIPPMIANAEKEGSPHFVGAGKTLMVLFLLHLTDLMGDIPYSQAFRGAENFTPTYDSQEQLYTTFQRLCDEAIVEFNRPQGLRALSDRSGDIFFQGDVRKWKRLAFMLKARMANHLLKKSSYNPRTVLTFIDSAVAGNGASEVMNNGNDAILQWTTQTPGTTSNLWAPQRVNMNNVTFGRFFINLLNGTSLGAIDPRMSIIAPGNRGGAIAGSGEATATQSLPSDFYGTYRGTTLDTLAWYAREDGISLIATNSEVRFIEAEAAFRAGDMPRAYTAYRAGIVAHMTRLGVPAAAQTTYLASAAVVRDAGSLRLRDIMLQKYIALFLNAETWVDMRRLDYSTDIYPNFQPPTVVPTDLMGQFPRRFLPGSIELLYNPDNAYKEFGGRVSAAQVMLTPVWWDKR